MTAKQRTGPLRMFWNGLIMVSLFLGLTDANDMRWNLIVYQSISWATIGGAVVTIALVIGAIELLWKVPALRWSWLDLFAKGDGEPAGENLNASPMRKMNLLAFLFLSLILTQLPQFAMWEESVFRLGTDTWGEAVVRSVLFGFVHCLVGVPLAVGAALSIGGLWFSYEYMAHGLSAAFIAHTAYNALVFGFAWVLLVVLFVVKASLRLWPEKPDEQPVLVPASLISIAPHPPRPRE